MQRRRSARLAAAPLASSDASSPSPSTPARGGRASVAGRAKGSKGAAAATMAAGGAWVTVADVVLLGAMLLYLFLCPYNKVEESFATQATHDLLFLLAPTAPGKGLAQYDHLSFPGVVPRSFWGPVLLAAPAKVVLLALEPLARLVGWEVWGAGEGGTKMPAQLLIRLILGLYLWGAFVVFRRAAAKKFGADTGVLLPLITATQFHLPFYMTRTLPNVFALGVILLAYSRLLMDDPSTCLVLLALTTAIFRCDTLVLAVPLLLMLLLRRLMPLGRMVLVGTLSGLGGIGLSVLLDSCFWRRWLWPEGTVLLFNTAKNRSSEWGVAPFHWYFTSALPRALLGAALLVPFGLLLPAGKGTQQPNMLRAKGARSLLWQPDPEPFRMVFLPVLAYVALYSLLAHKELRFVFPALPFLNLLAALGLAKLHRRRARRPLPFLLALTALLASLCCLPLFLAAARANYPGGVALEMFHEHVSLIKEKGPLIRLHIGVAAAETGVSRFGERYHLSSTPTAIQYSKTEGLPLSTRVRDFDYLIVEPDEAAAAVGAGCERVAVVEGKPSLRWREWVGAVGSVEALRALVKEWRGRESWEHWLVKTEPVSVLVHCQTGGGGGRGGMKRAKPTPKAQDLSEWTADE